MTSDDWTLIGLWLAVAGSGVYHGLNPAMGWPLAVSAALMERSSRALVGTLGFLAGGHFLGMFVATLPFALLAVLVGWQWHIEIGASLLLIALGCTLLLRRRHPRMLARIAPTQLGLWSFGIAIAHGAGFMLVPIYLGLCRSADIDEAHHAAAALMAANFGMALVVSIVHTLMMVSVGGLLAWLVYRHLGLTFISRSWFNLDSAWAMTLILVGAAALAMHSAGGV